MYVHIKFLVPSSIWRGGRGGTALFQKKKLHITPSRDLHSIHLESLLKAHTYLLSSSLLLQKSYTRKKLKRLEKSAKKNHTFGTVKG